MGASGDARQERANFRGKVSGREEIRRGTEVNQVVGNPELTGNWQLGGADIEARIDLHRVEIDDFSVEAGSEGQGEGGFAGTGGTGYGEDGRNRHQVFSGPISV